MNAETNTSQDISFSTDTFGNTIYATGKADKLQILGDLAKRIDVEPSEAKEVPSRWINRRCRRMRSARGDPDTALEVLQTLLAGAPTSGFPRILKPIRSSPTLPSRIKN